MHETPLPQGLPHEETGFVFSPSVTEIVMEFPSDSMLFVNGKWNRPETIEEAKIHLYTKDGRKWSAKWVPLEPESPPSSEPTT